MRQYADPPRLRVVRPRPIDRAADVEVDPIVAPSTRRSIEANTARRYEQDEQSVRTCDLILEREDGASEDTPVTLHSSWLRGLPPPLPQEH